MTDRVLALDPGKTTGYAMFRDGELQSAGAIEGSLNGFITFWNNRHEYWGWGRDENLTHIVCERYLPDGSVTGEDGIHSLRIEGFVIGSAYSQHIPLTLQRRDEKALVINGTEGMRNAWIDERFPDLTTQHARDAVAHFVVFARHNPTVYNLRLRDWYGA